MATDQRETRWNFRVKAQSDALVREAATLAGMTKTGFVEESAVARARLMIAEQRPISLSAEDFSRFTEALDEAPVGIPELVDLFSRPSGIPQS